MDAAKALSGMLTLVEQWEEKADAKKPVIKTGAEIPFTQYFYKYEQPVPSEELAKQFTELEQSVSQRIAKLFG